MHDELRDAVQRAGTELSAPRPDLQQVQRNGKRALIVRRSGAVVLGVALFVSVFALYPSLTSDRKPPEVSEGASDPVVSIDPNRLRVGDQAELRVHSGAQGLYGVDWKLEQRRGSSWDRIGYLVAGPGKQWDERFYLFPDSGGVIADIGFGRPTKMVIEIPHLEPGFYRLGQNFIRSGEGSVKERTEWHYAEFEVIEGQGDNQATCRPNVVVGEVTGDIGRHTTEALTPNIEIASGEQQGLGWTLCAYRAIVTVDDEEPEAALCEEFRYGLGRGSGAACSVGVGATVPDHWHYFQRSSDPTEEEEGVAFTGAISERVDKVVLQLDGGSDLEARIYDPPEGLGVTYRFFVGFAPQGSDVIVVVLDAEGNELGREAWRGRP